MEIKKGNGRNLVLAHFGLEVLQRLQCYEPQLTIASVVIHWYWYWYWSWWAYLIAAVPFPTIPDSKWFLCNYQDSVEDFRSALRRLRKVPEEVHQVLELLRLGVQVVASSEGMFAIQSNTFGQELTEIYLKGLFSTCATIAHRSTFYFK